MTVSFDAVVAVVGSNGGGVESEPTAAVAVSTEFLPVPLHPAGVAAKNPRCFTGIDGLRVVVHQAYSVTCRPVSPRHCSQVDCHCRQLPGGFGDGR
ncbi:hypothetical protein AWC02_14930 [Mycolicibacter engbaekii]|uniref:Uncharacterized protein n=1 Tax=Mycolicibacter engbaekii TaxID=188915 RepID=A0A1X1TJ47_9MYCO|nr:hypothetical protein AWC02_14930 [Mycolicibacter engbaekii]